MASILPKQFQEISPASVVTPVNRLALVFKALSELGPRQLVWYGIYQLGLRTGYYRFATRPESARSNLLVKLNSTLLSLPDRERLEACLGKEDLTGLLAQADGIVAGKFRPFGGEVAPLKLTLSGTPRHWTEYERGNATYDRDDVKFTWEPARFGWAYTLARAYHWSREERYAEAFWQLTEVFLHANPPYSGSNWASGQEVALRIIAFCFATHAFRRSMHTTTERMRNLAEAIVFHAERIPPTIAYARAQNNNHLLVEAVGLYTAGLCLGDHPATLRWRQQGWRWLEGALQHQIAGDGTYTQHSTNYQRLMLQVALWAEALHQPPDEFSQLTRERLAAATRWSLELADPETGRLPNLGPNDGAYILPLTACSFHDYRPVLQAAGRAFLGAQPFPAGPWDEMWLWLESTPERTKELRPFTQNTSQVANNVLRNSAHRSWAYLRAAHFSSRPGHADQLHLDLWWCGMNVAQDPGTYRYNAPAPWDNALTNTAVHNTLTVDGQEQMQRAGRFLYLDRAQAEIVSREKAPDGTWKRLIARHDGYRRLGVIHERAVEVVRQGWTVTDRLLSVDETTRSGLHTGSLHWLLPDWSWEIRESPNGTNLVVASPIGPLQIEINLKARVQPANNTQRLRICLVRAGQCVYGDDPHQPTWGWISPTYGQKEPGLALAVEITDSLPFGFVTQWVFPTQSHP